ATTSYWVRVSGSCGSRSYVADSAAARVQVVACTTPPSISAQPALYSEYPDANHPGDAITLTVGVASPASTYQWHARLADGSSSTAGATQSISVRPTVDSTYWVTITSPDGGCSIDSDEARVVVIAPPTVAEPAFEFGVPGQAVPLNLYT